MTIVHWTSAQLPWHTPLKVVYSQESYIEGGHHRDTKGRSPSSPSRPATKMTTAGQGDIIDPFCEVVVRRFLDGVVWNQTTTFGYN